MLLARRFVSIIVALTGACAPGQAPIEGTRPNEVMAIDGDVKCLSHVDWYITSITGPCDDYMRPNGEFALGEEFTERGIRRTINLIVATEIMEDFSSGELSFKRGDWYCSAAEQELDLGELHREGHGFISGAAKSCTDLMSYVPIAHSVLSATCLVKALSGCHSHVFFWR